MYRRPYHSRARTGHVMSAIVGYVGAHAPHAPSKSASDVVYGGDNLVAYIQEVSVCICICMNTLKIPILALIQREREHLLMVSESRFEALNGGSADYIFLQVVPL